jgi:hypothetical protein
MTSTRSPLGIPRGNVNLVQETLEAAGASQEVRTLAGQLVGEVRLSAGGSLTVDADYTPRQTMARYETHRATALAAITAAVQEYQGTGDVQPETLRQASVPGQPLSKAAVAALAAFSNDPVRGPAFLGQLSTAEALTRLTWECHELQEQLEAAATNNTHLSDGERALLQTRYEAMQRNLLQVTQKALVVEQHLKPALDTLLQEYTKVQSVATEAGIAAPMRQTPIMPFRRQQPGGYAR